MLGRPFVLRITPSVPHLFGVVLILCCSTAQRGPRADAAEPRVKDSPVVQGLRAYYDQMCVPKPLVVASGQPIKDHRRRLQEQVLACAGLAPLPERVPLDIRASAPLEHPWCTVQRIAYQLWPAVYSTGLLYMPKHLPEKPAPAMLCPHGHWPNGNAHPEVQKRCLTLAKLGYVTFSSIQHHYEDLYIGVSHQTLMIWNNMRALDYLETLPEVDKTRIGCAGASGGGLQTQMLVALDPRVKAASIVGLTCELRDIMFFDRCHCACNHFPGVMRFTDFPEISTLGLPAAVQYLTMNDWTREFEKKSFPAIRELYAANGAADRVQCSYFNTPHTYDRPKREQTYGWMEHWLRGKPAFAPVPEPDQVQTFPVETLLGLKADLTGDKGFQQISRIYQQGRGYQTPTIHTADQWSEYRLGMEKALKDLLGEPTAASTAACSDWTAMPAADLKAERAGCRSESAVIVPLTVLRKAQQSAAKLPVVAILAPDGGKQLLERTGSGSPDEIARAGSLVVLPDVRLTGQLAAAAQTASQRQAWQRNGILWGRPVPGMASTDLRAVLDAVARRADADPDRISMVARGSGDLAVVALFAAALDPRIRTLDVDLGDSCYANRKLALVSGILQHGDVLQWAAVLADRKLTLRNVPKEAGQPAWLVEVFAAAGNAKGLSIVPR